MIEFCPRCTAPLEFAQDPARLCEVCGWFGDWLEVLKTPPRDMNNPILLLAQTLELYREVCHNELLAEHLFAAGQGTEADMRRIRRARRESRGSIIEMFANVLQGQAPKRQQLKRINSHVGWPEGWTDRHYNASHDPCDMLIGGCSCGAWHTANEDWVRAMLFKHNAEIIDGDQP